MQFANPFAHPLFPLLAITTGVLLLAALGYALFNERSRLGQFFKSAMFQKVMSSAVLAPAAVLSILSGPGGLLVMTTVIAVIGVLEFASITKLSRAMLPVALVAAVALPLATAVAPTLVLSVVVVAVLLIGSIAVFAYEIPAASEGKEAHTRVLMSGAMAVLCVLYAPLLSTFAIRLSTMANGAALILTLILAVALSDTMALVIGKAIGRKKLAPSVSPNKTRAGLLGNIVGAYLGFGIMQLICPLPVLTLIFLPPLVGIACVMGDLFESLIKRSYGTKDAGTWLPGFGGLLDRVDSLLFVLPVGYVFLSLAL